MPASSNPPGVRTVNVDYDPTYYAEEEQYTAKIFHDFGKISMNFTGGYTRNVVDSNDRLQSGGRKLAREQSRSELPECRGADRPPPFYGSSTACGRRLFPTVPAACANRRPIRTIWASMAARRRAAIRKASTSTGSRQVNRQFSAELHVQSAFDGPFNFLLGGIYLDNKSTNTITSSTRSAWITHRVSSARSARWVPERPRATAYFLATPFYRNADEQFRLKSYGIFGETYLKFSDKLKLTVGLRYNHDQKNDQARNTALNVLTPIGATSITQGLNYTTTDFDPNTPGVQEYSFAQVSFSRLTGRAVLDYKISENNLLYISYSRGYKSGGINPPLLPQFNVSSTFAPEQVNAFEIGSKNTFMNGQLRLNLTGFYYQYKQLQLSRNRRADIGQRQCRCEYLRRRGRSGGQPDPRLRREHERQLPCTPACPATSSW